MWDSVLMCRPTFFDVREQKNPHMGMPIDRVLAEHQWENLHRALLDAGLKVELIDPVETLDDMVFSANQVFVGEHRSLGRFIIPSRMRYPSRHKEVAFYIEWFRKRGYKVLELDLNGEYLEGHGDLLWHPDHSRIWAAYGFRSTRGGVERFAVAMQKLGFPVTTLELVDEYCYHLDTCFCPLSMESVLICPDALAERSVDEIRNNFDRVHELTREEGRQFMGNGIVANGRFIAPRLSENLSRILAKEGLRPVVVNTSEFEKSGGSVFCMHCRI
jgi:N-dimethylarginine dimethylaminohydrolase